MQLVTFKMKEENLKKLDRVVRESAFDSRTEFIKAALREKIREHELREAIERLRALKGSMKGQVKRLTEEERKRVFDEHLKKTDEERLQLFRKYGLDKAREA